MFENMPPYWNLMLFFFYLVWQKALQNIFLYQNEVEIKDLQPQQSDIVQNVGPIAANFKTGGHLEKCRNFAWPAVDYQLGSYEGHLCQMSCFHHQLNYHVNFPLD